MFLIVYDRFLTSNNSKNNICIILYLVLGYQVLEIEDTFSSIEESSIIDFMVQKYDYMIHEF